MSRPHWRKILFFASFILIILTCSSWNRCNAESLKLKLEEEIGYSSYRQVLRAKRVAKLSGSRASALNVLFAKLVKTTQRQGELNYSLTVVDDPEVNAYALPGGYIFVNTGLLDFAATEGEIAGVLAHEIAHIDLKHSMKALTRAAGFSVLLQIAAMRAQNPDRATQAGSFVLGLAQKGYSRDAEYQADRSGVGYMRAAGYSKTDLICFFQRLDAQEDSYRDFAILQLISTHPPTRKRIERIQAM